MLSLISPAKSQDFIDKPSTNLYQQPKFDSEINQLVQILKLQSKDDLASLMSISDKLANEVYTSYQNFKNYFSTDFAKQAIFAFKGDVYRGLNAETLKEKDIEFANAHLLMVSGLYGLLKPLDLIQPYRLEMGAKLDVDGQSLYQFWRFKLTGYLNDLLRLEDVPVVINLASKEYAKVFDQKSIEGKWIDVDFKEYKDEKYKIVGLFAKRARGLMARYIIDHRIDQADKLIAFKIDDYHFNEGLSKPNHFIFTRGD